MAEFDGEAASLGLFHEFFSHLSTKSADDRVHHSGSSSAVSGGADRVWKNGFGGINRVDDINKKQHSFSKSFLQPSLLHNKSDNTSAQEEHVNNNNTADLVVEDDDDGSSSENMSQKSVHLEHLNKRTLAESPSSGVVVEHENVDESDDSDNNEHVNAHRSLVNGTAGPVPMSYDKKKKGVTFPKDTIISGYLDPHDPWKLAPAWTTDELVSAYKKSCELYGAKPIAKLIQQLQAFSPANSHEEVLSLKGEKLDQKQCECLEEILRRVRFKLLDFEASHLDDECAVALFDMIEFYESSYQLNIAFNKNIQARGWQACSRLVRRTPELKSLDLRNCDLNERTIPIFGRALKLGCHLTILHMENMNLSGRPLIILVAALKMNDTLQELFLADNKLLPTDGIQLGNLLHYNHKLGLLDLRNNHLQDVGTRHICEGLTEQNKGSGLRTLVLWNNSINYQAMSMLGRALASSQNMETLNIGHNAITNEGVHLLKDGLLRVSSLLRLGLQGTRISDEGAVALAEYIAESLVLLRIDLRDNDIKTGGLMALAHAMRVNTSVTRIDLDKDPKKEPGIRDYVEQQSRLLKDILTFQQRNVQLALQKEEEKRSHLQEKAEAELADAKKETHDEQHVGHLPANSSTESFTLIDEVPVEIDEDNQPTENTDADAVMAEKGSSQENASPEISNHTDELDSSPHKEGGKLQQRPTVLFPWHVLSAQETLDSPLAISGVSHNKSTVSDAAAYESCSEGVVPVLPMTPAPAEIILSPQYFPKQIARKIFSVSRVSENASCQQLSSSPPLSLAFDPLCVSPLPLIPVSSTPVLLPPTVPVLQCVQRVSQHSKVSLQTDSPSASLFQHLAEETMKHLISPDTDADVSSLLQDAESDGLNTWINKPKDRDELITGLPVELDPPCAILKSSDTELADLLQAAASSEMLTEPNGDIHVCDNVESLVNDATDMLAIVSPIDSDNSDKEHLVITDASVGEHENSSLQDSAQELLTLERITENAQYPHAFTSQEFDLHQACTDESQDSVIGNHFETRIENDDSALKATTETVLRNPTNTGSHEENFPESEQRSVHAEQLSELPCNSPFVFVDSATDVDMKINEIKDSSSSVKSNSGHQQKHVTLCVNTKSLSHSEKKQYSPILADMDAQDDLMALRLINLSNSSLHSAENIEELLFPILPDPYTSNQPVIGDSEKSLVSSLKSVQRLETGNNNNNVIPAMPPAKNMGHKLTNDPSDDQGIGDKVASDNIDIDSVDCSLDEEPWLTVGVDVEGHDSEASRTSSKQPDFFTTLSMNGLAQELASALTSFDGSSSPFEVGDYNIGS